MKYIPKTTEFISILVVIQKGLQQSANWLVSFLNLGISAFYFFFKWFLFFRNIFINVTVYVKYIIYEKKNIDMHNFIAIVNILTTGN